MLSAVLLIVSLASLHCAILLPTPPPALSAAKFVRGPSLAPRGKVSASAGIAVVKEFSPSAYEGDDDTLLEIPAAEAAASFRLAKWYDLATTIGTLKATIEGNAILFDYERFRMGLLHGIGGGFRALLSEDDEGDRDWLLQCDLSVGLMVELPSQDAGSGFASVKYTYGNDIYGGRSDQESEDDGPFAPTHYFSGSIGWLTRVGPFELAPEVIVSRASSAGSLEGGWPSPQAEWHEKGYWIILTGVTMSAPF